ncbi:MAG: succinylglutamate desuccinylase/aspartoacylase family protein [Candidatus Thorarchaeota archaeon]|nr:succinylglutamate desuccinylase/aspartoacylase family protein [Candidatus Thorarchaeota archaeon]
MKTIEIGTAKSSPGAITYGHIEGIELPTGGFERIPVIIAQGNSDGPTIFLTANVHGNELTGVAVIHKLVTKDIVANLKGTIIAIPTLNPSVDAKSRAKSISSVLIGLIFIEIIS